MPITIFQTIKIKQQVQKVVGKASVKARRRNFTFYLIKWRPKTSKHLSWQPSSKVGCLKSFNDKIKSKQLPYIEKMYEQQGLRLLQKVDAIPEQIKNSLHIQEFLGYSKKNGKAFYFIKWMNKSIFYSDWISAAGMWRVHARKLKEFKEFIEKIQDKKEAFPYINKERIQQLMNEQVDRLQNKDDIEVNNTNKSNRKNILQEKNNFIRYENEEMTIQRLVFKRNPIKCSDLAQEIDALLQRLYMHNQIQVSELSAEPQFTIKQQIQSYQNVKQNKSSDEIKGQNKKYPFEPKQANKTQSKGDFIKRIMDSQRKIQRKYNLPKDFNLNHSQREVSNSRQTSKTQKNASIKDKPNNDQSTPLQGYYQKLNTRHIVYKKLVESKGTPKQTKYQRKQKELKRSQKINYNAIANIHSTNDSSNTMQIQQQNQLSTKQVQKKRKQMQNEFYKCDQIVRQAVNKLGSSSKILNNGANTCTNSQKSQKPSPANSIKSFKRQTIQSFTLKLKNHTSDQSFRQILDNVNQTKIDNNIREQQNSQSSYSVNIQILPIQQQTSPSVKQVKIQKIQGKKMSKNEIKNSKKVIKPINLDEHLQRSYVLEEQSCSNPKYIQPLKTLPEEIGQKSCKHEFSMIQTLRQKIHLKSEVHQQSRQNDTSNNKSRFNTQKNYSRNEMGFVDAERQIIFVESSQEDSNQAGKNDIQKSHTKSQQLSTNYIKQKQSTSKIKKMKQKNLESNNSSIDKNETRSSNKFNVSPENALQRQNQGKKIKHIIPIDQKLGQMLNLQAKHKNQQFTQMRRTKENFYTVYFENQTKEDCTSKNNGKQLNRQPQFSRSKLQQQINVSDMKVLQKSTKSMQISSQIRPQIKTQPPSEQFDDQQGSQQYQNYILPSSYLKRYYPTQFFQYLEQQLILNNRNKEGEYTNN